MLSLNTLLLFTYSMSLIIADKLYVDILNLKEGPCFLDTLLRIIMTF